MLLRDKVGLVTGGGDGIGRATAIMFAKDGAKVTVADVRHAAAKETVALIKQSGGAAIAVEADVSKAGEVKSMAWPLMAPMIGPLKACMVQAMVLSASSDASASVLLNSCKSKPAQNALPLPVSINTRTA